MARRDLGLGFEHGLGLHGVDGLDAYDNRAGTCLKPHGLASIIESHRVQGFGDELIQGSRFASTMPARSGMER